MKKQLVIMSVSVLMATSALAQNPQNFAGFFGSLALNASFVNSKIGTGVQYLQPLNETMLPYANESTNSQINPGLYFDLGYSWRFQERAYLGVEFFTVASPSVANATSSYAYNVNYNETTQVPTVVHHGDGFSAQSQGVSYGASIMPGYVFTEDSVGYVKFSVESTSYDNTIKTSYFTTPAFRPSVEHALMGEDNSSNTVQAYSVGLGYEKKWRMHWSIFAELNYALPVKYTVDRTTVEKATGIVRNESFDVQFSNVNANIGLRYRC